MQTRVYMILPRIQHLTVGIAISRFDPRRVAALAISAIKRIAGEDVCHFHCALPDRVWVEAGDHTTRGRARVFVC